MIEEKMAPIHPGEILKEDFIDPMGISQYRLAKDIGAHPGCLIAARPPRGASRLRLAVPPP